MKIAPLLLVGAMTFASLPAYSGQPEPPDPSPRDPRQSIVCLEASVPDAAAERKQVTGLVTPDGHVLSVFPSAGARSSSRVRTESGATYATIGIASYLREYNIALIAVDWGTDGAPTALPLASRSPAPGDALTIISASTQRPANDPPGRVNPGQYTGSRFDVCVYDPALPLWGGAVLLDSTGAVAGLGMGFSFGVSVGFALEKNHAVATLNVVSAPVLARMKPLPVIEWKDWPDAADRIERAREHAETARKAGHKGEATETRSAARLALSLDDRSAMAWRWLGWALHKTRREEALKAYSTALEMVPTDASTTRCLATLLATSGRGDEALAAVSRAEALAPGDSFILQLARAEVFERLRRYEEAKLAFEEAVRLKPADKPAKDGLERVRKALAPP